METKDKYAERIAKLPKPHELHSDASPDTQVNYGGIAMSKKVVDALIAQKKQEQIQLPDVHTSANKMQEQKHQPTTEIENTKDTETYVNVELDADNNIISGEGDVQVHGSSSDKNENKPETPPEKEQPIEISDDDNGKTSRKRKLPNAEEIEKYKIIVTVAVDSNKLTLPVPEGEQDPNFKYCPMCGKKFIRQRHLEDHVDETCPYLTEKTRFQCPHCNKTFSVPNSLRDHLSYNYGYENRFKCNKCGEEFSYQRTFTRHKDDCK